MIHTSVFSYQGFNFPIFSYSCLMGTKVQKKSDLPKFLPQKRYVTASIRNKM